MIVPHKVAKASEQVSSDCRALLLRVAVASIIALTFANGNTA
jgi:hypothetical protein